MTKEPADWAKIKAYRAMNPETCLTDDGVLALWPSLHGVHELARMYDKYEQPPVDPDLLAAREWYKSIPAAPYLEEGIKSGRYDSDDGIQGFLAGIKHGRANP